MSEMDTVRVHLASSDIPLGAAPQPRKHARRTVFLTVTLTADDPAQPVLPASDRRVGALVQALDADVTLARTQANAASGTGTVVPKANTGPYPVEHDGPVYAGASLTGTATARVSITAVYED